MRFFPSVADLIFEEGEGSGVERVVAFPVRRSFVGMVLVEVEFVFDFGDFLAGVGKLPGFEVVADFEFTSKRFSDDFPSLTVSPQWGHVYTIDSLRPQESSHMLSLFSTCRIQSDVSPASDDARGIVRSLAMSHHVERCIAFRAEKISQVWHLRQPP